jgi:hypothetical protein
VLCLPRLHPLVPLILLAGGCAPRDDVALVDPERWVVLDASDDPFAEFRPASLDCSGDFVVEAARTEIRTDGCGHVTLSQPSLTWVAVGELVDALVQHTVLVADEPATAHAVLRIGDVTLLDAAVPIPSPAEFHPAEWEADARIPAGAPVVFHVRNHGANAWRLEWLRIEGP